MAPTDVESKTLSINLKINPGIFSTKVGIMVNGYDEGTGQWQSGKGFGN